jgi:chemotaxis protein MotB
MSSFNLRSGGDSSQNFKFGDNRKSKNQEKQSSLAERRSFIESRRVNVEETDDADAWMVTYSDMVTLLLTFFILLFSMSEIDQSKFEEMKGAISGEMLKKEADRPFDEIKKQLQDIIEQRNLEKTVQVDVDPLGVRIEFASSSLYESGSAAIKRNMEVVIDELGQAISNLDMRSFLIEVEGHTDDIPIRSAKYESNWELSSHRATNIVKLLIKAGIPVQRLKASGFSDSRPVAPNRDVNGVAIPENQEKNRRVLIFVRRNQAFSAVSK